MNTFISLYYLIQSIILGIFIVHIYHSFIAGFDTLLLITDILVFVISLWILIRKSYNEILCFTIFLTFSIFVGLFEIPLLVLGNGAFIFLLLSIAQFVLNSNFTLKNINVINLSVDNFIKQNSGNLIVENCIFKNNAAVNLIDVRHAEISKSIIINNNQFV